LDIDKKRQEGKKPKNVSECRLRLTSERKSRGLLVRGGFKKDILSVG